MIVKNISGAKKFFGFTPSRGYNIDNNGTATVPDTDLRAIAKAREYVLSGDIQIVSGPSILALQAAESRPACGALVQSDVMVVNETFVVGGITYETELDPGSAVLGEYNANLSDPSYKWAGPAGANAAAAAATMRTAINHPDNVAASNIQAAPLATVGTTTVIPLVAADGSVDGSGLTLDASGAANTAASGATLNDGAQGGAKLTQIATHTVTAAEVTAGAVVISTGLQSFSGLLVQIYDDSTGVLLAWDGEIIADLTNGVVTMGIGTAAMEAGDEILLYVKG